MVGAFAGYVFLLFMLVHYNPAPPPPPTPPPAENWQAWHVDGVLALERDTAVAPPLGTAQILRRPTSVEVDDTGGFSADILVKPGPGGAMEFPTLVTSLKGYAPVPIDLSGKKFKLGTDFGVVHDDRTHEIHISEPIFLHELPSEHVTVTAQKIQ